MSAIDWTGSRLDIEKAATTIPPQLEYVVGGLPEQAGTYGLILGSDGARKSWLALHLAIACAAGQPVAPGPDGTVLWPARAGGRAVYITSEDGLQEMHRRVHAIANSPGYEYVAGLQDRLDIHSVCGSDTDLALITQAQQRTWRHSRMVSDIIEYARGARLVVLDVWSDWSGGDENAAEPGRVGVSALRRISREVGGGLLVTHHLNKAGMLNGDMRAQAGRGWSGLMSGSRWTVTLTPGSTMSVAWLEERGIADPAFWSVINEGKTSYDPPSGATTALYHYPPADGHGAAALARAVPAPGDDGRTALPSGVVVLSDAAKKYKNAAQQSGGEDDDDNW